MFQKQHFNWLILSHQVQNYSDFSQYNGGGVEAWPIETCGYFSEPVLYKVGLTKLSLDAIMT